LIPLTPHTLLPRACAQSLAQTVTQLQTVTPAGNAATSIFGPLTGATIAITGTNAPGFGVAPAPVPFVFFESVGGTFTQGTGVVRTSTTRLTVNVPAGRGTVFVRVANTCANPTTAPCGVGCTCSARGTGFFNAPLTFTYTPTVTSVTPNTGGAAGNTREWR
jgi:hypothetical protein